MHKKQSKKKNKNQVGVHKNTPLASQISYEDFEESINKYLDVSSPGNIFDLLDHTDTPYNCECTVTEEMMLDSLIDLDEPEEDVKQDCKSFYKTIKNLKLDEKLGEDSCLFHSEYYEKIRSLYNKQREINIKNSKAIKEYIRKPLEYFGTAKLLRDIDESLGSVFKKKKYKKVKKGSKIFDRSVKSIDNSAAEDILTRLNEFKEVFPSLEYPIYEGNLCEENVETEGIIQDSFQRY